ncbi:MAG: cytochrome d ubiquinol oxidase subunit II [Acidisphaera sp.]|nr:cytochrome d ubiquinol oxidase subunit II [Acidisphaera sp.]
MIPQGPIDFVPIWTLILGLGVFFYVMLDGFDLGVGILYGFARDTASRNLVMNSIAPIWDGNETWLVLGGVGLFAAFPIAFGIIIPAVYFPILVMLLALIFRGVAFEFRFRDAPNRTGWDHGFCYGSLLATFAQGIVLGAFIQGFRTDGTSFTGSSLDCFTPFSLITGLCLVFGYMLLGAGWLVLKMEGEMQDWARRLGRFAFIGVALAVIVVSIWTPIMDADIRRRWFSWPNIALLSPVPIITAVLAWAEWSALNRRRAEYGPFVAAIGLFVMSYLGIAISLWPMIVPHRYTLWQAASAPSTQAFLLVGTLFLLPVILMYTGWSYWVFRGKVRADIGYH